MNTVRLQDLDRDDGRPDNQIDIIEDVISIIAAWQEQEVQPRLRPHGAEDRKMRIADLGGKKSWNEHGEHRCRRR